MSAGHGEASVGRGVGFESESPARVVIVGAGMAGLTAAAKLFHSGVTDLVVLEAQDYVGGRIQAQQVDGRNIDMGAQFIHGQVGNPLFTIARTLGILMEEDEVKDEGDDDAPFVFLGSNRPFCLCSNGEKLSNEGLTDYLEFIEDNCKAMDPSAFNDSFSVGDMFRQSSERYMEEHGQDISPKTKELLDAAYRSLCAEAQIDNASGDLFDLSAWAAFSYEELKGNRYNEVKGGMTSLLKAIRNLLPDGVIHTSCPVTFIKWGQGGNTKHPSIVTCENGEQYEADYVIVTISSRCLMEGRDMFHPPLPSIFTKALGGLRLGGTGKVYLRWETPFWDCKSLIEKLKGDSVIDFLWLKSNPIAINCDTTKRQTQLGKPWWEGCVGCELVTQHPDMLEFWFTEDQVKILEQLKDDEVISVLHEILKTFFNDDDIPKPIAIYRSMWLSNPFVRGTYTYPTVRLDKTAMDILTTPVPSLEHPQLLFAGEAFSLESIGSAHGAYNSGQRNADVILKSLGIEHTKSTDVSQLIKDQITHKLS